MARRYSPSSVPSHGSTMPTHRIIWWSRSPPGLSLTFGSMRWKLHPNFFQRRRASSSFASRSSPLSRPRISALIAWSASFIDSSPQIQRPSRTAVLRSVSRSSALRSSADGAHRRPELEPRVPEHPHEVAREGRPGGARLLVPEEQEIDVALRGEIPPPEAAERDHGRGAAQSRAHPFPERIVEMPDDRLDARGARARDLDAGAARAVAPLQILQKFLVGVPHLAREGGHPVFAGADARRRKLRGFENRRCHTAPTRTLNASRRSRHHYTSK